MIIVKIGGSLYSSPQLKEWIDQLTLVDGNTIVIVPGGGTFADQVRDAANQWDLSEQCSHHMAVLAMQQFAFLLAGLNVDLHLVETCKDIQSANNKGRTMVWLPYKEVSNSCDYPKNWQVTSDSLAIWLASKLSATHMCLVKSAQIDGFTHEELLASGVVDNYFTTAMNDYSGHVHFYHVSEATNFMEDLKYDRFK